MGMIDRFLGLGPGLTAAGQVVTGMAEVFTPNRTRQMELEEEAHARALAQFGEEFRTPATGWFDRFVNALNRLPRPVLTLSTLALMGYAMVDPVGFAARMHGLAQVPEPLWWLMGAVVSFYFGAREAHYARGRAMARAMVDSAAAQPVVLTEVGHEPATAPTDSFADNAALRDWAATRAA